MTKQDLEIMARNFEMYANDRLDDNGNIMKGDQVARPNKRARRNGGGGRCYKSWRRG